MFKVDAKSEREWKLRGLYSCAVDWAQDLRFDFDHAYITGCPFMDSRDVVVRLMVDAFLGLDDAALKAL